MPNNPEGYLFGLLAVEATSVAAIIWVVWHRRSGQLMGYHPPYRRLGYSFSHVLVVLVAVDAMERRLSGPSFLTRVPVVGRVAATLMPRLPFLLFIVALWLLFCVAFLPRNGQMGLANEYSQLWILWIAWAVVSSLLTLSNSTTRQWNDYLLSVAVLLASLLTMRRLSAKVRLKVVRFMLQISSVLSLASLVIDRNWAMTTVWTGGFLRSERLQGIFPQPNTAGAMFAVLLVITLLDRSRNKIFATFEFCIACIPLYMTGSRGAAGALILALLAALAFRHYPRVFKVAFVVLAAGAVLAPIVLGARSAWLNGRATTWTIALDLWSNNRLIGGGAWPAAEGGKPVAFYAHNQLLQSLAETGIVGALLIFGALRYSARRLFVCGNELAAALLTMVIFQLYFENSFRIFTPQFVFPTVVLIAVMGADLPPAGVRSKISRAADQTAVLMSQ